MTHSIEVSEEAGVRYLHFGSEWVQGAMRVARPYGLELEYTRDMAVLLGLRADADWPRRLLQVGLGAASITKHVQRAYPQAKQTIVEINPQVVTVAQQSFKLSLDDNTHVEIADATSWISSRPPDEKSREKRREKFDCIIVDGYDQHARFGGLGSREFYADCRERLTKRGLLILNLFGRSRGYRAQLVALDEVFAGRVLALPAIEGGNAVVAAAHGETVALDLVEIHANARAAEIPERQLAATMARLRVATAMRVAL